MRSRVFEGSIAVFFLGAVAGLATLSVRAAANGAVEAGGNEGDVDETLVADEAEALAGDVVEIFAGDLFEMLDGDGVGSLVGDFGAGTVLTAVVATARVEGMIELSSSSQSISSSATADKLLGGGLTSTSLAFLGAFAVGSLGLLDVDVDMVVEDRLRSDSCKRATSSAFFPVCGRERDLSNSSSSAFFFLL